MNWAKLISGFSLSIIFLAVMFFAVQGVLSLSQNQNLFFASILGAPDQKGVLLDKTGDFEKQRPYRNWSVPEFFLNAESGIVADVSLLHSDKILFKKNSLAKLPIASLTKLMTAIICLENYSPDQKGKLQEKEMPAVDLPVSYTHLTLPTIYSV